MKDKSVRRPARRRALCAGARRAASGLRRRERQATRRGCVLGMNLAEDSLQLVEAEVIEEVKELRGEEE